MVQKSLNLNQAEKADTIWLAGRRSPLSPLKPSSLPTFPLHSPSNLCFISYPQSCHSMVVGGGRPSGPKQVTPDWLKQVIIIFLPLNKWLILSDHVIQSCLIRHTSRLKHSERCFLSLRKIFKAEIFDSFPLFLTDMKEYNSWTCRKYHTTVE